MLKVANPGLSRRFQLENAFDFPDYSDEDLVKILLMKTKKMGIKISTRTAKAAVRMLARARAKPNFGNAGAVDNLLSEAISRMQKRPVGEDPGLTLDDFGVGQLGPDEDALEAIFDDLVGCHELRDRLAELVSTIRMVQSQGGDVSGLYVGVLLWAVGALLLTGRSRGGILQFSRQGTLRMALSWITGDRKDDGRTVYGESLQGFGCSPYG